MLRTLSTVLFSAVLLFALAIPAAATPYTVQRGDTLASIARSQSVAGGWQALHAANRSTVPNPNRISVGQRLTLPGSSAASSPAPARPAPAPARTRASASAAPADARGAAVVAAARSHIGARYRYGGTGAGGFDCSGLTQAAWRAAGVELPRTSRAQHAQLNKVAAHDRQPGDLVVYGNPVHHIGIYVGDNRMVHASRRGVPVREVPVYTRGLRGYVRP